MSSADPDIGDYAAIGNCRTLALVSRHGCIDWWCLPDFGGPSLLAALLDRQRGGCFALTPHGILSVEQRYEPMTNVLGTRLQCEHGVLELVDFMSMPEAGGAVPQADAVSEIVRIARCMQGRIELDAQFAPRPDYARRPAVLRPLDDSTWLCGPEPFGAVLRTTLPLQQADAQTLSARVVMQAGEQHQAVVHAPAPSSYTGSGPPRAADVSARLAATQAWWQAWCGRCRYQGPYRDEVMRSCLALKLLTHAPTGAVVAAGTTSIPEGHSGARNWDYRYCWLRDTAMVLHAFHDLGYTAESDAFLHWLLRAGRRGGAPLHVVYDVHGRSLPEEYTLPQLRGYHGLGPVRIANHAARQRQNDIYGEVVLTAFEYAQGGGHLDEDEQALIAALAHTVCELWRTPDHGLWEIRLAPRHNTHSKLMCWVALDRALQLHQRVGLPLDEQRVRRERDAVRDDIEAHGFDVQRHAYTGFYGDPRADASLLLMPRLGYADANDARMRGTMEQIRRQLSVDGLLRRYPAGGDYDGVSGTEEVFALCSFWWVDCLARQGRVDEAQALYERLLGLRNHVGLYAEEFDLHTGRPVGNFPQAFSHVGSITAAVSIATACGTAPVHQTSARSHAA